MINNEETLDLYDDFLKKTSDKIIIYVEGKTVDKYLYYSFPIFKKANIIAKGSASNVKKKVEENHFSIGIIDRDYSSKPNSKRVFKTRYYSIENMALVHNKNFYDLRKTISNHTKLMLFNPIKYRICNYHYSYDSNIRDHNSFFIIDTKKHHSQFFKYIRLNIYSKKRFLRLKDLKKVVKNYSSLIREKRKKEGFSKVWHIEQILGEIREKDLLNSKDYRNIRKYILM